MFNKLKHKVNKKANDVKHGLGFTNEAEHSYANLQEDVRFQWTEFKGFLAKAEDNIVN
jgi:hypothetical protein